MRPVTPIIPGQNLLVTEYAKDQPEYKPMPVWKKTDGTLLSRWHLTWRERLTVLLKGDIYLSQMTFNQPMQPVKLEVERSHSLRDWMKWAFCLRPRFGWAKTPGGFLCWDFQSGDPPRIYWSKDATPSAEAGMKVILN